MAGGPENAVTSQRKEPEFRLYGPRWWHLHGNKMRVSEKEEDRTNKRLVIKGSAAQVVITRREDVKDRKEWLVDYQVTHYVNTDFAQARVSMGERELAAAFGINETDSGEYPADILERFGGDSASQGTYIRYRKYLNIPGPGTGHDGDPNVSIEIDDEMKLGVSKLLFG